MRRKKAALRFVKKKKESSMSKGKKILIETVIYLAELLFVILLAFLIVRTGFVKCSMMGDSMTPTLVNGDSLLVNKFAYMISEPHRFDVVAYRQGSSEHSYMSVKRIIGLPGDNVLIKNGEIYINGEMLSEDINTEKMITGGLAESEIILDENEYFVLGDNRNNSEDSRFANVGNVVRNDICGKVWIRLNSFGFVDSFNHKEDNEVEDK